MSNFPIIARSNKCYPCSYHKIYPRRKTLCLLPFDGSLSLSLFGTATMDDVNISASHINALTKISNNIVNALQKHNEHMTSFMSTANKRMDNLQFFFKTQKFLVHHSEIPPHIWKTPTLIIQSYIPCTNELYIITSN